jgi:hypothetical protein
MNSKNKVGVTFNKTKIPSLYSFISHINKCCQVWGEFERKYNGMFYTSGIQLSWIKPYFVN